TTEEETEKKAKSNLAKKPICPQCGSDDIHLSSDYEYERPKDIHGDSDMSRDKVRVLRTSDYRSACANCYFCASTSRFFSTTATSNHVAADDFGCC
ncbi:unnamed protein product, partial [Rotaria magnacalcarata]